MNPHGLTDADLVTVLAMSVGNALDVIDGALCMPDPADPAASVPVPTDTLDRLEAAEFVEVAEAGACLTDRARYYLGRWMAKHYRRRRTA